MSLLWFVVTLVCIVVILWVGNTQIELAGPFKMILNAIALLVLIVMLLQIGGVNLGSLHVGK